MLVFIDESGDTGLKIKRGSNEIINKLPTAESQESQMCWTSTLN